MKYLKPYFLVILILLVSCVGKDVAPWEYVHYVEDPENGLLVKERTKGIKYTLQYQPVEYVVMMEKRSFDISPDTFDMLYNHFKGLEHYVFRIGRKGIDSITGKLSDTLKMKAKMAEYFGYQIQKNIKLVEGNDTLECAICQFDGDYGIAPYYSFVLGFPVKEYSGDRRLLYDDKLFNTGEGALIIKGRHIRNIPNLKRQGV